MTALRRFWPPIAWMAVIFLFSTGLFGAGETGSFIEAILRILYSQASPRLIGIINITVRKAAHLTEYAVLALLWFRAIKRGRPRASAAAYLASFSICALYALTDEYHQSFVPGRTASLVDVTIDSAGAAIALAIIRTKKQRTP